MGSDERHHSGTGQIAQRLSTLVGANDVGARPWPGLLRPCFLKGVNRLISPAFQCPAPRFFTVARAI